VKRSDDSSAEMIPAPPARQRHIATIHRNDVNSNCDSDVEIIPAPRVTQPPVPTYGVFSVNIPFRFKDEVIDQVRSLRNRSDNAEVQYQRVLFKLIMNMFNGAQKVWVSTASDMPHTPTLKITLADCLLLEHAITDLLVLDVPRSHQFQFPCRGYWFPSRRRV